MTGGPEGALWAFMIFYATCAILTWFVYSRKGGMLHDIERGRATPSIQQNEIPQGEPA